MQESNHSSKQISHNSDSEESEISGIPQLQKHGSSFTEEKYKSSKQYIKVSNKNIKIDEEGILEEFNKNQEEEIKIVKNTSRTVKKVKNDKVPANPSKKCDLGSVKRKWKAQMDQNITKFKQYLKQQKKAYDGKQKESLLEFYKVLLDGIFELKYYSEDPHNDLTNNEKRIINPQSDYHIYLKDLVQKFDQTFREAKMKNKILQTKDKWDPLIKSCRDENNYELRRKIIRAKIKPISVLDNNDEFLMSEEAKLRQEKIKKLILNEAEKNFEKPLEGPEEHEEIQLEQHQEINELPEPMESMRSMSSNDLMERKLAQQRQKMEEFKQVIGDEFLIRMKKRIIEDLTGTSSYDRIMGDFKAKFRNV